MAICIRETWRRILILPEYVRDDVAERETTGTFCDNRPVATSPHPWAKGQPAGGARPAKRDHEAHRPFASRVVPPWVRSALEHPAGRPAVVALGWLTLLAAAGSLVWILIPPVSATVGSSGLTYNSDASASATPGWLIAVLVLGSMIGFNLVYWFAPPQARVRHLTWIMALYCVELLGFVGCVVWVSGAGYPAGAVLTLAATDGDGAIGITGLLGICLIACGTMLWLNTNSTYEQQREQYLHSGRTTVTITKVAVRTHVWLVLGPLFVWTLLFIPMIASHVSTHGGHSAVTGSKTNLVWPTKYTYGDTFDLTLSYYSVIVALVWAMSLSLLVEKVLYGRRWAARAKVSNKSRPRGFARLLVKLRHWPFVLGVTLASLICFTPVNPDDSLIPNAIAGTVVAAIGFGLGLLFFRWEWKARDMTCTNLRLHLAGS